LDTSLETIVEVTLASTSGEDLGFEDEGLRGERVGDGFGFGGGESGLGDRGRDVVL
jgi:hypothetical protein